MQKPLSLAAIAVLVASVAAYPVSDQPTSPQKTSTPTVDKVLDPRMLENTKAIQSFEFVDQISLSIAPTPVTERLRNHIFLVEQADAMGAGLHPALPSDEAFQEGYKEWTLSERDAPEEVQEDVLSRRLYTPDGRKPAEFPFYTFNQHRGDRDDREKIYGSSCMNDLSSSAKVGRRAAEPEGSIFSTKCGDTDSEQSLDAQLDKRVDVNIVSWRSGSVPPVYRVEDVLGADGDIDAHLDDHEPREIKIIEQNVNDSKKEGELLQPAPKRFFRKLPQEEVDGLLKAGKVRRSVIEKAVVVDDEAAAATRPNQFKPRDDKASELVRLIKAAQFLNSDDSKAKQIKADMERDAKAKKLQDSKSESPSKSNELKASMDDLSKRGQLMDTSSVQRLPPKKAQAQAAHQAEIEGQEMKEATSPTQRHKQETRKDKDEPEEIKSPLHPRKFNLKIPKGDTGAASRKFLGVMGDMIQKSKASTAHKRSAHKDWLSSEEAEALLKAGKLQIIKLEDGSTALTGPADLADSLSRRSGVKYEDIYKSLYPDLASDYDPVAAAKAKAEAEAEADAEVKPYHGAEDGHDDGYDGESKQQSKEQKGSIEEGKLQRRWDRGLGWSHVVAPYWDQRSQYTHGWEPEMADEGYNVHNEDRAPVGVDVY